MSAPITRESVALRAAAVVADLSKVASDKKRPVEIRAEANERIGHLNDIVQQRMSPTWISAQLDGDEKWTRGAALATVQGPSGRRAKNTPTSKLVSPSDIAAKLDTKR